MKLLNYFAKNIGVDLGTTNSLVYLVGKGIIVNEPSVVAINNKTGQILAIGEEAKKMVGRTPAHIAVIRPLVNGVISDFETAEEMLRHFFKKIAKMGPMFLNYNRAVIGISSNLTEVERKSVEDALLGAGAARAYILEEPIAAAIGARLPIYEPTSNMIVDIGGGTTEIAVISMGGTVTAKSIKIAGDKLNDDIIKFIRDEFHLAIGEPTAEEVKAIIGTALPTDQKLEMPIRGRDMATGLPRELIVKDFHVRTAISKSLKSMVDAVKEVIESAPPELVGDILKSGIYMCGGGSLLKGIDKLLEKELMVSATIVDDPLTCVVRGTGAVVENFGKYAHLFDAPIRPKDIKG